MHRHHRHSVRMRHYDYAQPGLYFVTICTHHRSHLFGEIINGEWRPRPPGEIARDEWFAGARHRPYLQLVADEFVVMPNHIHGIVRIVSSTHQRSDEKFGQPVAGSLATIARAYKAAATKRINFARGTAGAPVWQRGYHDHVLRDDGALERTRHYIAENRLNWRSDPYR